MLLVWKYTRDGIRVKRVVEVNRVKSKKDVVLLKVNRRKVKHEGSDLVPWKTVMGMLETTLTEVVQHEPIKDDVLGALKRKAESTKKGA